MTDRGNSIDFVCGNGLRLDMSVDSAYTTEFLDGPGKHTEGRDVDRRQGLGPDKVKTGMDKKRLDYYKKKLLARRDELTKTIARTQEEGRTADEDPTGDLADKASNSYTEEFLFGMAQKDRTILNIIDAALKRIPTDGHCVCAHCHQVLQPKR